MSESKRDAGDETVRPLRWLPGYGPQEPSGGLIEVAVGTDGPGVTPTHPTASQAPPQGCGGASGEGLPEHVVGNASPGWHRSRGVWRCCADNGTLIPVGSALFATGRPGEVFCERHAPKDAPPMDGKMPGEVSPPATAPDAELTRLRLDLARKRDECARLEAQCTTLRNNASELRADVRGLQEEIVRLKRELRGKQLGVVR